MNPLTRKLRLPCVMAVASASLAAVSQSRAQLEIYEPFDYPATGNANDGVHLGDGTQSGALGLTGNWSSLINNFEMEVRDTPMTFRDASENELPVSGLSIRRSDRGGFTTNSIAVDPAASAALTGDNTTMWMSFLYVDEGFSGPDSSVMLASEPLALENNHSLGSVGNGVGILIGESAPASGATVETGYYLDSTTTTRAQSTLNPNNQEGTVFLLAAKINWRPDGTPDEIFVFNITDLTTEPQEADAIVSDTFDMPLTAQRSLDTLNIGETQVDAFDEIRFGSSFADVVGAGPVGAPLELVSLTSVGGNVWEIEVTGAAGGAYVFRSAADLAFEAGGVVGNLTQGDPGDAGTISGTENQVLTLDENGNGVVRVTFDGKARDFVRVESAP